MAANNETLEEATLPAYGPSAILHSFSNTMTSPILGKVLPVKGVYRAGKGVSYGGQYYDILKDEVSDANITLIVPESIRQSIGEGQVIEGAAYMNKRLNVSTGRIDLLLALTEVSRKKDPEVDPLQQRAAELLRLKVDLGYKDIDRLIKERLYNETSVRIAVVIGLGAIVDQDILHQLKDAAVQFQIEFFRVNLTRSQNVVACLQQLAGYDFVVITRGGGENLQVFDEIEMAEQALRVKAGLVTAIGHAVDKPLLQKIADKSFITPTAFGQYLYDIYNLTKEEMSQSKAKLIANVSKQLEVQFQHRVVDLTNRLAEAATAHKQSQYEHLQQITELAARVEALKSRNSVLVIVLVLVAIAAIAFGAIFQ